MKNNILTKSVFAALLLASTVVTAEEQYPAADFEPTVIYSDAANDSKSSEAATSSEATATSSEATASEDKAEKTDSNTFLFGLVVLAVAGGFFLSKKPKCKAKTAANAPAAPSYSSEAGGATGVEKYLQAQNASAATGVEKYLAKKDAADKEASVTGVDKYLRNRG